MIRHISIGPSDTGPTPTGPTGPVSWYAARTRAEALIILAVTALAVGGCLEVALTREISLPPRSADSPKDVDLYQAVVRRVHRGEGYYAAAGSELKSRGYYPIRSIFNVRLPTYAWVLGGLPGTFWGRAILVLASYAVIGMAMVIIWREAGMLAALLNGFFMIGASLFFVPTESIWFTEFWSGLLIALSCCALAFDRTRLGVGAGLMALAFRELALPYCIIALIVSLKWRRRAEAAAWAVGLTLFLVGMSFHGAAVRDMMSGARITGDASYDGSDWIKCGGAGFILSTAQVNAWLLLLPGWCTALYLPLALLGLAGWRQHAGIRVCLTASSYIVAFGFIGQDFNKYWGLMDAPLLTFGVARAPAALHDLIRAACRPGWRPALVIRRSSAGG